jgi:hypothetical protein
MVKKFDIDKLVTEGFSTDSRQLEAYMQRESKETIEYVMANIGKQADFLLCSDLSVVCYVQPYDLTFGHEEERKVFVDCDSDCMTISMNFLDMIDDSLSADKDVHDSETQIEILNKLIDGLQYRLEKL